MNSSPVQRLMSRRTRHSLPTAKELLKPQVVDNAHEKILLKRQESKLYYDKQAKEFPKLEIGQHIRMKPLPTDNDKHWRFGTCVESVGKRSYLVDINGKIYRRNRKDLRPTKESHDAHESAELDVKDDLYPPIDIDIPSTPPKQSVAKTDTPAKTEKPNSPAVQKPLRSTRSRTVKLPSKFNDFEVNL